MELLKDQLRIIFIDGKNNKSIIPRIMQDNEWELVDETAIAVNKRNKEYKLLIYKRNSIYLIYYGCFLYGGTCPSYEQARKIADHIKKRNSVIVNLKRVTNDQAKRIIDFLSGTLYALGGQLQKLGNGIYLCTPKNINVEGRMSEDDDDKKSKNKIEDEMDF